MNWHYSGKMNRMELDQFFDRDRLELFKSVDLYGNFGSRNCSQWLQGRQLKILQLIFLEEFGQSHIQLIKISG